jgi:hypothetical protein
VAADVRAVVRHCCRSHPILITFALKDAGDGGTTLLFSHSDWRKASEFMSGCSTNWGAYLTSLKNGAEGRAFSAYPNSEISRWG